MPGARSLSVALADLMKKPLFPLLIEGDPWECDADAIDDGQILLLLASDSSLETCTQAVQVLAEVSPKKIYLLKVY
jgi:hypothetical protein